MKYHLDHQLSFVKDQNGWYQLDGYKTVLANESKPGERRHQFFNMQQGHEVNSIESYNLLSGRSVQVANTWMQLDFNDKDPKGNYRIKQFHSNYGYDLEKVLQQLPLKELDNKEEENKLREALKNGSRISVSFIKDGNEQHFYIEANPQFKSINIYDEHSRKITLQTALGNKTMEPAMKVTHKINEQQNQRKKNSARIG